MCDEIIAEEAKTVTTNCNEKNLICKTTNFCILLAFLLIAIALLIAISIYCYLRKHRAKQKHLLQYYTTNGKLTIQIKMSNKLKDIDMENHTYFFSMISKFLSQMKLK